MYTNIVRDYNKLQGMTNPADAYVQPVRDINTRYVSIENSSNRPFGVALMLYPMQAVLEKSAEKPDVQFIIGPKCIRHLAVNPQDLPLQYIHLFDMKHEYVGFGGILRTDANEFVIRDGVNMTWIQPFRRSRVWSAQK